MNNKNQYPEVTRDMLNQKAVLAPENIEAWRNFSKTVFKAGVLDEKTKQLIAVAVAHVTQCPYSQTHYQDYAEGSLKSSSHGAIWVGSEMRAGAAYAHANIAMDEMNKSGIQDEHTS